MSKKSFKRLTELNRVYAIPSSKKKGASSDDAVQLYDIYKW